MSDSRCHLKRRRGQRGKVLAAIGCAVLMVAGAACSSGANPVQKSGGNTIITMWSWLSASDGQVWARMIQAFNKANDNKGLHEQIKMTSVVDDYNTKLVAAVDTGNAPDFGWSAGGNLEYQWAKEGVIIPLNDLMKQVGLDVSDFTASSLSGAKYPSIGGDNLYMVPYDITNFGLEINVKEAEAAGLDAANPPQNAAEFLHWAQALTIRKNGKITQAGLGTTLAGVGTTYWGIVAAQMGFQRISSDGKTACVNKSAGESAMNWLLDLMYKYKVVLPVTSIYDSFDTGQSAMIWEGPWSIFGNNQAGLDWEAAPLPQIGPITANYIGDNGLEIYKQKNSAGYKPTMEAIKWLSDNSWLWVTGARGVTPRKSILNKPGYDTATTNGFLPKYRKAYIDGLNANPVSVGPVSGQDTADFEYYEIAPAFIQTEVSRVLAHQLSVPDFMSTVCAKWQQDIDSGGVTAG
jgi:multiple sugar transport system substrate-binding protein